MFFNIHGVGVSVESSLPEADQLISDRLTPYLSSSLGIVHAHISIQEPSPRSMQQIQAITPTLKWVRNRPFFGELQNGRLFLTDGASLSHINYTETSAHLFVQPNTLNDSHFFARTFFLLTLTELLRTQGFFYLHAALVKNKNRTVLMMGKGGAGKSTLCAALLKTDWNIICDDNILLKLNPEGVCLAFPLEQELSLSTEVASQLDLKGSPSLERGKLRYRLNNLPMNTALVPNEILSFDYYGEQAQLFQQILNENPMLLAVPHLAKLHTQTIQTLISQCRTLGLSIPRMDPIELLELARHFPVSSPE